MFYSDEIIKNVRKTQEKNGCIKLWVKKYVHQISLNFEAEDYKHFSFLFLQKKSETKHFS